MRLTDDDRQIPEADAVTREERATPQALTEPHPHPARDPHPSHTPTPTPTDAPPPSTRSPAPTPAFRCIGCNTELTPPAEWWCSNPCIEAWARRTNPGCEAAVDALLARHDGTYPPRSPNTSPNPRRKQP
jgi:hypothetical protein